MIMVTARLLVYTTISTSRRELMAQDNDSRREALKAQTSLLLETFPMLLDDQYSNLCLLMFKINASAIMEKRSDEPP